MRFYLRLYQRGVRQKTKRRWVLRLFFLCTVTPKPPDTQWFFTTNRRVLFYNSWKQFCRCTVPDFMNDCSIKYQSSWFVLTLQFSTGPSLSFSNFKPFLYQSNLFPQVRPPGTVPVPGPGRPGDHKWDHPRPGFWGGPNKWDHPSHSQTSRLLTSSLSLGVPVPRGTQCIWGV